MPMQSTGKQKFSVYIYYKTEIYDEEDPWSEMEFSSSSDSSSSESQTSKESQEEEEVVQPKPKRKYKKRVNKANNKKKP